MNTTPKFCKNYESLLDNHFESILKNDQLSIPGFVVLAKRGEEVYHKAFGVSDLKSGKAMQTDSMFRMYSMTKVLTSFVALRLYEEELFNFDDPVSKFIPSFDRSWEIVVDSADGAETIDYKSILTGENLNLGFNRKKSEKPMLIKHLMSESAGIEYDLFSEYDSLFGGGVCDRNAGLVANALRQKLHPEVYRSSSILGANLSLRDFVDIIGNAGVLTCEPGEFSYGHGATVLGRIIEILYERSRGEFKKFSEIMSELLFEPLDMNDAAFFLADDDRRIDRIPTLYGALLDESGLSTKIAEEQECYPEGTKYVTNQTAHFSGPRLYESGDTGTIMTAHDYSKFYDMLLHGGLSKKGERLLSEQGIATLCKGRFENLQLNTSLAKSFGVAGDDSPFPKSFNFGWATAHGDGRTLQEYKTSDHSDMSHWGGYALTQGFFYPTERSYMLVCPQMMSTTPGAFAFGQTLIRDMSMSVFHSVWN
jgi:CubicO group peptidase (beta-lactamase class C family)